MNEVIRFKKSDDTYFSQAYAIRQNVFVEEQGVDATEEFDEFEDVSVHYLAFTDKKAVATARWRTTGYGIKLERFAVLKAHRGQGVGNLILNKILDEVVSEGKIVYLHAQVDALRFYQKNNFACKGDMFVECNIEHYLMEYNLGL